MASIYSVITIYQALCQVLYIPYAIFILKVDIIFHLNNEEVEVQRAYTMNAQQSWDSHPGNVCLKHVLFPWYLFALGGRSHSIFSVICGKGAVVPSKQLACCTSCAGPGSGNLQTHQPSRVSAALRGHFGWAENSDVSVNDCNMRKKVTKTLMKTELKGQESSGEGDSPVFYFFLDHKIKRFIFLSTNKHPPTRLVARSFLVTLFF